MCSVEGHVIAVGAEGDARESCIADKSDVLHVADTFELLCFDTEYIAGSPDPVHEV